MQLLVDGLSTMPERTTDAKGIAIERVAARMNLSDASYWILDPETFADPRQKKEWAIRGFFKQFKPQAIYHEFMVTDAGQSLAARQQFTDQVGLITAAFYQPLRGARGLGTTLGHERRTRVETVGGYQIGDLLSVIHIRYVAPAELRRISR
jgi:hypothetical protein